MLKFLIFFFLSAQVFMLALYCLHLKMKKADLADFGWVILVFSAAGFSLIANSNFYISNLVMFCLVFIWAVKLGSRILTRLIHAKKEDSRYAFYRKQWAGSASWKFLVVFMLQPVFATILCLPFVIANFYGAEFSAIGLLVCLVGMLGSYLSDYQLAKFKRQETTARVCQEGLWKYSRHPNYFFEWITWCGYVFFLTSSSYFLLALLSPVVMYLLLVHGTGVPPLEYVAVQKKGQEYIDYQKTTNKFFLGPQKK